MRPYLYMEPDLPTDDELDRLNEYVGGDMTPADEAAFDEQLATDEAFYHRMAPMLKAWTISLTAPSIIEAGVRIQERQAAKQRAADHRRALTIRLTSLVAAASVIFGIVETGVLRFTSSGGTTAMPTLAQRPLPKEVVAEVAPEVNPHFVPFNDPMSDWGMAALVGKPMTDPAFARISSRPLGQTPEAVRPPTRRLLKIDTVWLDPQHPGGAPGASASTGRKH